VCVALVCVKSPTLFVTCMSCVSPAFFGLVLLSLILCRFSFVYGVVFVSPEILKIKIPVSSYSSWFLVTMQS